MKTFNIYRTSAFVALIALNGLPMAFAATDLSAGMTIGNEISKISLGCDPKQDSEYYLADGKTPDQNKIDACGQCKEAIQSAGTKLSGDFKVFNFDFVTAGSIAKAAASASGSTGSGTNANQHSTTTSAQAAASSGGAGLGSQSSIATLAVGASQECAKTVQDKCSQNLSSTDNNKADSALQQCQYAQSVAQRAADEAGDAGSKMDGMSGMLGQAAQGLGALAGPLMNAMKSQPKGSKDSSGISPSAALSQSLGKSFTNPSVAFDGAKTAASKAANPFTASSGGGYSGASRDYDSTAGLGSNANTYEASGKGASVSGGGSSPLVSSTGASKMPDVAEEAAKTNDADFALGGVAGGSRPMLGLKGKAGDLDPILEGAGSAEKTESLEMDRSLASTEDTGIFSDSEKSLFHIVHDRISDCKLRGCI